MNNGMEPNMQQLWQQRFGLYVKETMGYWQYAARSNFVGFVLFLVIVASYYYAKKLQHLPTNYPYIWIVLLVLVPVIAVSPIRTLLKDPDRMFLMRIEQQMGLYFRSGFIYSFTLQAFGSFVALIALWPLYRHCEDTNAQPLLLMLALLWLIKMANLLASWQESRMVYSRARAASVTYRWIATFVVIGLQFLFSVLGASAAALILVLIWLAAARYAAKFTIGWETLIAREKQAQSRLYAFFSWFVDVPQLPAHISRRSWISGITRYLPFRQDAAYSYLYMKTLLRTELFGIVLRMTGLGIVAISALSTDISRASAFVIVVFISMVQLSSLNRAHRYTFWLDMYPLQRNAKAGAVAHIMWRVLFVQCCVLALPMLLLTAPAYWLTPLLSIAAVKLICAFVLRRKFQDA